MTKQQKTADLVRKSREAAGYPDRNSLCIKRGLSRTTLDDVENNVREPSLRWLRTFAKAIGRKLKLTIE